MSCLAVLASFVNESPKDSLLARAVNRGPKEHINMRILQTMISGIRRILGLGTRMSDPYVYTFTFTV